MNIAAGIVLYLLIFWVVIFMVLPWWVNPTLSNKGGTEPGAPETTHLKKKFLITALISAILWGIAYLLIDFEVISFHELSKDLYQ